MMVSTDEIWYLYQNGDDTNYQTFSYFFKAPILLIHAVNLFLFIRIMQVLVGKVKQDMAEKKAMQVSEPLKKIQKPVKDARRDSAYSSETATDSRRPSLLQKIENNFEILKMSSKF